jgi:hypothetical protein
MRSLYTSPAANAAKPPAPANAQTRKTLYDGPVSEAGSHDLSLSSYYGKYESGLRHDAERLSQARAERRQLLDLAQKRNISPASLHEALTALGEHEAKPRSAKTTSERFARTFEALRLAEGSTEAATRLWEQAQRGAEILNKEVPSIATRATKTGVVADIRAMRLLASLDETPPPPAAA